MADGWGKIPAAADYAGVKPRKFRDWLKMGLPYVRPPGGCTLVKFSDIDEWLQSFAHSKDEVEEIVEKTLKEIE